MLIFLIAYLGLCLNGQHFELHSSDNLLSTLLVTPLSA